MKYRKKPVVVEAYQWESWETSLAKQHEWPQWLRDATWKAAHDTGSLFALDGRACIKTLEGAHAVSDGDYIIQGIAGELYPCREDIFHATYEAVTDG